MYGGCLAALDIQHHGSHHKIDLEEKLFLDQCEKDAIHDFLPFDNAFEIRAFWKQANQCVSFLFVLEAS